MTLARGQDSAGHPWNLAGKTLPNHGASRAPFKAEDVRVGRVADPGLINKLKG